MKKSRFRISHLFLILFLLSFAGFFAYWFFSAFVDFGSTWYMLLFYIPTLCVAVVLPAYGAIGLVIDDIKKIRSGENNSLYDEEKN